MSPATPLPPELSAAFEQRYGIPVVDGFTHEGCHTANPPYGIRKPGTAGLPLPGVDVAIAGPDGRLLPAGLPGEVLMRGPGTPRDGWLRTGRTGRFDQDGYLVLGGSASSARAN
jgi:acyl-coenzyme A synthetase/AMP-(fatty) acid ligase